MGPFGSRIKAENFVESGVPVLKGGNLHDAYINDSDCDFLTEEKADELKSSVVYEGDIVITHRGTIGQVSIVSDESKYPRYVVSQSQLKISLDKTKVNPYYVNYYLRSRLGQHQLLSFASQVGVPAIAKASTSVKQIRVPCPPLTVQDQIVDFVRVIDRKYTNNSAVNQTLEEMAQAIFKSWFVDFDPVKAKMAGEQPEGMDAATASLFPEKLVESELGLIPEGWEVKPLGDVSTFQNGFAFKSKELTTNAASATHKVFKMGNIRKGGGFNSKGSKDYFDLNSNPKVARYLIKKGDLLMSMTDMKNNVALLGHTALMPVSDEYLVNQRVGLIRKSDKHYLDYSFLYYQTNEPLFITDVRSRANSGVQVNLSTKGIKDTLLVVPPKEIHDAFDKQVRAFLEMIFANDQQSEELASLRDLLLPKLLSGEIELGTSEELVEAI